MHVLPLPKQLNEHFQDGESYGTVITLSEEERDQIMPLQMSDLLSQAVRGSIERAQPSTNSPPGSEPLHGRFRRACWSRAGAAGKNRCVLAMLTADHQLLLASGRGNRFRPNCNLTEIWTKWLARRNFQYHLKDEELSDDSHMQASADLGESGLCVNQTQEISTDSVQSDSVHFNHSKAVAKCVNATNIVSKGSRSSNKSFKNSLKESDSTCDMLDDQSESECDDINDRDYEPELDRSVLASPKDRESESELDIHTSKVPVQKMAINDIMNRYNRLMHLAIKEICWSPEEGMQSELLMVTACGYAILWRFTTCHSLYCDGVESECPNKASKNTSTVSRKPLHQKMTDVLVTSSFQTTMNSVCTGDFYTVIQGSYSIDCPDVTCLQWLRLSAKFEVLFVGTASGVMKVFAVQRSSADRRVRNFSLLTKTFRADGTPVMKICLVETSLCDVSKSTTNKFSLLLAVAKSRKFCSALFEFNNVIPVDSSEVCTTSCRILATAETTVCNGEITDILCADRNAIYCCTQRALLLQLSIILQPLPTCSEAGRSIKVLSDNVESVSYRELISTGRNKLDVLCYVDKTSSSALSLRRSVLEEFTDDGMSYLAVTTSPNKIFYAFVQTVYAPYDHLMLKEISRMWITHANCLQSLQEFILKNCLVTPLYRIHDALAAVRLRAAQGEHLDLQLLHEKLLLNITEPENRSGIRLLLWLSRFYMQLSKNSSCVMPPLESSFRDWDAFHNHLWLLLQQPWLQSVVKRFHDEVTWLITDLDPCLVTALSLICDQFIGRGPSEYSKMAMDILLRMKGGLREQCRVGRCQLPTTLESLVEARCTKRHLLPRCSLTLLSVPPLFGCRSCKLAVDPHVASEMAGKESLACLVCEDSIERFMVTLEEALVKEAGYGLLAPSGSVAGSRNRRPKDISDASRI